MTNTKQMDNLLDRVDGINDERDSVPILLAVRDLWSKIKEEIMARELEQIVAHIRAVAADPSISTTLIQTEDLLALCDAASPSGEIPDAVEDFLTPKVGWKMQPFEYYAAQFLVGCGLTHGDIHANVRALAGAMQKQYDAGVEHGHAYPEIAVAR